MQTKKVEDPLPKGSAVTDDLSRYYQQIAESNVRLGKLVEAQGRYIEENGVVNEAQLQVIRDGQRRLDELMKQVERLQTRVNVNRP